MEGAPGVVGDYDRTRRLLRLASTVAGDEQSHLPVEKVLLQRR